MHDHYTNNTTSKPPPPESATSSSSSLLLLNSIPNNTITNNQRRRIGYSTMQHTTTTTTTSNHIIDQIPEIEPFLLQNDKYDNNNCDGSSSPTVTTSISNITSVQEQQQEEHASSSDDDTSSFLRVFIQTNGPPQIVFLCILCAIGFGCTIGIVPTIMTDRYAQIHYHFYNTTTCSSYSSMNKPTPCFMASADAQQSVAMEQMISNFCTFLTSSYVGSLSDEYGRKVIMIIGIFISSLSPLFLIFIQLIPSMDPFWYYSVGAISGLVSWIGVALSTLSDVMPPKWRAPSFGLIIVGFSLGFAIAPQLAFIFGHFYVSLISLFSIWISLVILIFYFPETLPPETAQKAKLVRQEQMNSFTSNDDPSNTYTLIQKIMWLVFIRPFWELSILNRNRLFRLLSCLAFFSGMVSSGDRTLLVYYIEERLDFTDKDIATMFLIIGLLGVLVQGYFLKVFNDWFGERNIVIMAFVFGCMNNIFYAMAHTKTMIFIGVVFGTFVGMSFPTISAIKSNNVDACEQGRIQGALYSLSALASALGPISMRLVYQYTKDGALIGPGTMFLFATMLYMIAVYCAYLLPVDANSNNKRPNPTIDDTSIQTQNQSITSETPLLS